jgi:mannose-1-phosphate guanylyltransferase/phosphomannomutase
MVENLKDLIKGGRIVGRANYVFTPEISSSIGSIHGSLFGQNESIVIGRDYHNDSRMLKRAYTSGIMSTGINLLNLSDCTFPMLQFTIRRFGASGGVYVSGGHLYSEDVGIRFVDAGGIELAQTEIQKIVKSYNNYPEKVRRVEPNEIGQITAIPQTDDIYIKSLQQFVNKKRIKKADLRIVVDCSYGPTGKITPLLLNDIGVEVIALNTHYRERSQNPVPNINTIRNTANIVKASNSHLGICFDVDGSRILVIDENGLEVNFEELLMLFVSYDERIQKSKANTVITTPSISPIVKRFIEDNGFPVKQVENIPGEISRQIREERACFAASDTLKFYLPEYSPFSDGNFILLKILEIMTNQNDLISSLTRGFPKGIKINKSISISPNLLDNFHNQLIELTEKHGYKYLDIINELKIIDNDVFTTIKVALNRSAILLSAESCAEDTNAAKSMIQTLEEIIKNMEV